MKIYAIIPARGGSKGVPGKNIKLLNGKPLIEWTILAAKNTPEIAKIIVNTDDSNIAKVAESLGAEIFYRPKELALDLTEDLPVFTNHLEYLEIQKDLPDIVVDLRATAPLRRSNRISEGIKILLDIGKNNADSVRAVSKAAKHPYKMWKMEDGFIKPFLDQSFTGMKESYNAPRQVLPDIYQNNGAMNVFWSDTILNKKTMTGDKIAGFVMEDWESVNIDTEIDFMIAEELMKRHQNLFE